MTAGQDTTRGFRAGQAAVHGQNRVFLHTVIGEDSAGRPGIATFLDEDSRVRWAFLTELTPAGDS